MNIEVKHHAPIVYKVYEELKFHIGKNNAISADELCSLFPEELYGYSRFEDYLVPDLRKLRTIIREIRRSGELEKVIGSCRNGYYVCTKDDAQKAIDRIMNTAKNMFKTAYIMSKKVGLDGQMKIQFNEFCADTYHSLMEGKNEFDKETN